MYVIIVGLVNFLAYTIAYLIIGGEAIHGQIAQGSGDVCEWTAIPYGHSPDGQSGVLVTDVLGHSDRERSVLVGGF